MPPIPPEQLALLYRRHQAPLLLYARSIARHDLADDLVQEAFLRLARQKLLPRKPRAWLMRTLRNSALSLVRRWWIRRGHHEKIAAGEPQWFIDKADDLIDAQRAQQALEALPLALREVLILRIWGELTFQQIARTTKASVSTVHSRYQTALQAIRKQMVKSCETIPNT